MRDAGQEGVLGQERFQGGRVESVADVVERDEVVALDQRRGEALLHAADAALFLCDGLDDVPEDGGSHFVAEPLSCLAGVGLSQVRWGSPAQKIAED